MLHHRTRVLDPKLDGITHINMYSKSATAFGRMLSNWAPCRLNLPEGQFRSVEGYWYYLSIPADFQTPAGVNRESLKYVWGYRAKSDGRALRQAVTVAGLQPVQTPDFQEKIMNAIEQKLAQNTELFLPQYRGLPIEHYYVYGSKLYDMTLKFPWLTDGLQRLVDAQYKKLNP